MATATTTAQVCRNFINGRWVDSRSGCTVERRNPANLDEIIGLAPLSTREETREAIVAARSAFAAWRDTPAPVCRRVIAKAALVMEQQKEELARIVPENARVRSADRAEQVMGPPASPGSGGSGSADESLSARAGVSLVSAVSGWPLATARARADRV